MTLHEHAAALRAAAQAGDVEAASRLWSLVASLDSSQKLAIEMFPLAESATEAVLVATKSILRPELKRSRRVLITIERELAAKDVNEFQMALLFHDLANCLALGI